MEQKIENPSVEAICIIIRIQLPTLVAQSHYYYKILVPGYRFIPLHVL